MKANSMYKTVGVGLAGLALMVGLSACGGGGSVDAVVATPFDISVAVGGHPVNGVNISPGVTQTVYLPVGQSIQFDASESVIWTLMVGGSAVTGTGVTVDYGGVGIRLTTETDSRISIDTASDFSLSAPLSFTLVATSTYDNAQVATIQVVLTN
ncbi:MAG: hypothetical protein ABIZ09_03870 [Rhodoferax sp.]|jgi:hypothetical protein